MGFTREDVEGLSAHLREPGWVLERRLQAWDYVQKLELPREKEEPWRYTDLKRMRFSLDHFSLASPSGGMPEETLALREEGERAGSLIQRHTEVVTRDLNPELAEQGVILTDINTAIAQYPELMARHLFAGVAPDEHLFAALHAALFAGGAFLYVPRGVTVALPIETQLWIDQPGVGVFPHTLMVVEEDAEVAYIERYRSPELPGPSLCSGAVEIVAGRAARISFVSLQEYGGQVWNFQCQRAVSESDVTLRSLVVNLGARFSRVEVESVLRGERSFSEMLGLYFAEEGQDFDMRTLQDHVAPASTSDLLYKGALRDRSHTIYAGLIRVNPGAAKTDAYQANRNLVLSDEAKADSKPELEILNNDVRCTHGSTVGQIDSEELFYLQARGISVEEAQRLIVYGFFEEVLKRVGIEEIRLALGRAITRKLEG
ncbi:MAG: Fe-S cluster assembly protein SufD [Actinomycetota bacterium]